MEVELKILFNNHGLLSTARLSFTDLKTNTSLSFIAPENTGPNGDNRIFFVLSSPHLENLQLEKSLLNLPQIILPQQYVPSALSESNAFPEEKITTKKFWVKPLQDDLSSDALSLIRSIEEGFEAGFEPELCEEGINGTYFLKDKNGNKIGVFKPKDEEGNSPQNPKKNSNEEDKELDSSKGIKEGEAILREVAAYLLDSSKFHGVPLTFMTEISHPSFSNQTVKKGSIQYFVKHDGCSEDISVNSFPVKEVHKIGILDIMMFNMDRHGGNILYQKTQSGYRLVPIDHGFSLPEYKSDDESSIGNAWFDWLTWGQAKEKFDEESKKYIESIDMDINARLLTQKLNMSPESITTMKIGTMLLKKGAKNDLSLHDIANIVCREDLDQPSTIEILCKKAEEMATEKSFLECLSTLMDEHINNLN